MPDLANDEKLPIDILRLIIIEGLSSSDVAFDPKRVMIWNNRSVVPRDKALFIIIEHGSPARTFANSTEHESRGDDLYEIQSVTKQEFYNIDIMSRNNSAERRKEEIVMALRSMYSQNQQEERGIMIAKIANLIDISGVEGSARLFRFQCSVTLHASYTKEKVVRHYDTFDVEVNTENDEQVTFQLT